MATATTSTVFDNSTDANFRAWGSNISTQLAAMGLVQTADTGQINWASVTRPTVAATVQGYEMWRFNDALQATAPVFIKIEYGSATNSPNRHGLWVTVGTATNGAGTLTGTQVSARKQLGDLQGNTADGNLYTSWFSGATNRIAMALDVDNATPQNTFVVVIERSHDATGADTGDGVNFVCGVDSTAKVHYQFVPMAGGVVNGVTQIGTSMPAETAAASAAIGTTTVVGAVCTPSWTGMQNPMLGLVIYVVNDFNRGTQFDASVYGASHHYIAVGNNRATVANNHTNTRWAIRFE